MNVKFDIEDFFYNFCSWAKICEFANTYLLLSYGPDKLRWEEAEEEAEAAEEEKIRLKQYVSFRSKGRHN
jgi:hypothetical protein